MQIIHKPWGNTITFVSAADASMQIIHKPWGYQAKRSYTADPPRTLALWPGAGAWGTSP